MMKAESFLLVTTTSPVRVVVKPWEEGKLRRGGGGGGDLEGFSVRYRGTVSSSAGSQGARSQGTYNPGVRVPRLTPRGINLAQGRGHGLPAPSLSPSHARPVTPPLTALSPLATQMEKLRPRSELWNQDPHFDRSPADFMHTFKFEKKCSDPSFPPAPQHLHWL